MNPLRRLWQRPDFRRHPLRALARRLWFRARWLMTRRPWRIRFAEDMHVLVPRSGTAALVYYQDFSEPETARFIRRFLTPGMVFVDVGAHWGEYCLLGARAVGPQGQVHGFEPNAEMFGLLQQNLAMNGLRQVSVHEVAVSDREGTIAFDVRSEPALSSLARPSELDQGPAGRSRRVEVRSIRLDDYFAGRTPAPDLIKIDVEGAELLVFAGAASLLDGRAAGSPTLVFEISHLSEARFGTPMATVLAFVKERGYRIWSLTREGSLTPYEAGRGMAVASNVVATRGAERPDLVAAPRIP